MRRDGIIMLGMLIVFLNFWDAVCTIFLVEGHYAREVNPFMAFFLNKSWLLFFVVKMGLAGFGAGLATLAPPMAERWVIWMFIVVNVFYLAVVANNLYMVCHVLRSIT